MVWTGRLEREVDFVAFKNGGSVLGGLRINCSLAAS